MLFYIILFMTQNIEGNKTQSLVYDLGNGSNKFEVREPLVYSLSRHHELCEVHEVYSKIELNKTHKLFCICSMTLVISGSWFSKKSLKNGNFFRRNYLFKNVKSCFHPGSNRGPFACEANVITTTLRKPLRERVFLRIKQTA